MTIEVFVTTVIVVKWDKKKRLKNLKKHGLDFNDAGKVLESPFRLDVETVRNKEMRTQSFAYVFDHLAVLTVVHIENENRIISFRRVSRDEREVYHEWLGNEFE